MEKIIVNLGERSYPIFLGINLLENILEEIRKYRKENRSVIVVTTPNLLQFHKTFFQKLNDLSIEVLETSVDGEKAKCTSELLSIWEKFAEKKLDRASVVFAIGGGVIGDLTGFAAASYLRGIQFVQVPTTLLAMTDSSVGGKTGINLIAGKNLVGAFYQPNIVFIDMNFLKTLPSREFSAGVAEIIKYGLLGDEKLFEKLEVLPALAWNLPEMPSIIKRCCEIKAAVVANDEKETQPENGRALLNLGHTFGHAIEKIAGYGEYLHGEAVAIGNIVAAEISVMQKMLPGVIPNRIRALNQKNNLPIELRTPLSIDALLNTMKSDKKVRAGTLHCVLLKAVGNAFTTTNVSEKIIRDAWKIVGAK